MTVMVRSTEFSFTYYPVLVLTSIISIVLYTKTIPQFSRNLIPKYNQFDKMVQREWNTRVLSNVHSMVVSCLCIYELLFDYDIVKDPVWCDSVVVRTNCAILTGFVIADMLIMTVHAKKNLETVMYYFHHSASAYAYFYVMSYGVYAYFANFRMMAEFSTPFVNQRWFLDTLETKRTSRGFIVNGLLMTFTFISARVLSMPHFWYKVYGVSQTPDSEDISKCFYVMVSTCVVLDILNLFWSAKMLRGARKVLIQTFDSNRNIVQSKLKPS